MTEYPINHKTITWGAISVATESTRPQKGGANSLVYKVKCAVQENGQVIGHAVLEKEFTVLQLAQLFANIEMLLQQGATATSVLETLQKK